MEDVLGPRMETRLALSPREMQVLELISEGLRTRDISTRLEISEHTVRSHIKGVLRKLHVRSRVHALSEALRRGVVQVRDS